MAGFDQDLGDDGSRAAPGGEVTGRSGAGGLQGTYLYTDANGKRVYRGADGNLYTDDPDPQSVGGFIPYTGPDRATATPPAASQTPPPKGGGGPAGTGAFPPFTLGFAAPPERGVPSWLPQVPAFTAPALSEFLSSSRFEAPSFEQALNEPGYQFREKEGQRALEQSAAGKGLLRTGGTLKDLLNYGQQFAAQEYQNVFDRARTQYQDRFQNELAKYGQQYKGALDAFQPLMTQYTTQAQATQRQNELDYQRAYDKWLQQYKIWKDEQDARWGRYRDAAGA